jgi:hypothetical protein
MFIHFSLLPTTRHVEFEKDDVPVLNHIGFPLLLVFSSSLQYACSKFKSKLKRGA